MLEQLLPLALSVNTVAVMWLVGSKRAFGWALGLAGQGLWVAFSVVFEAWGLLLLAGVLTFVYGRNLLRWRKETDDADGD